jgi:uncharacterized protein (DUF1697 family)
VHTYIALLRAVNLGPHNKVRMADLCAMAAGAGLREPRTLLASGNLVFSAAEKNADRVARLLEREAAARLGLTTTIFVRSAAEWEDIVADNPFPDAAETDPAHLVFLALVAAPSRAAQKALSDSIAGREKVRVVGRAAYAVYPDGIGDSKLTAAMIERKLGTQCTGRNWNTVLKLRAAASAV